MHTYVYVCVNIYIANTKFGGFDKKDNESQK